MRLDAAQTSGWEFRCDRGELLPPVRKPDGTLLLEGIAVRECVLEYPRTDGTVRRELVPLSTIQASAHGLGRAPVTLLHPPKGQDVGPKNFDRLGVGDTDGRVEVRDGGFTHVFIAARRQDAIDAIKAGTHELSPGYRVRLDETPGTHPIHGPYDAVQAERVYNHLAIVPKARGGESVAMRVDGADALVARTVIERRIDAGPTNPSGAGRPQEIRVNSKFLRLLSLLGITSRIDSDDAALDAACDALSSRKDAADTAAREAQKKLDALTAERDAEKTRAEAEKTRADAEKARADAAEGKVKGLEAAETKRADAEERKALDALAEAVGVDPKVHADNKALRRAIASAHLGTEVKADADDVFVRGVVEGAKVAAAARADGLEAGAAAWQTASDGEGRTDGRPGLRVVGGNSPRNTMADRWGGRPVSRASDR